MTLSALKTIKLTSFQNDDAQSITMFDIGDVCADRLSKENMMAMNLFEITAPAYVETKKPLLEEICSTNIFFGRIKVLKDEKDLNSWEYEDVILNEVKENTLSSTLLSDTYNQAKEYAYDHKVHLMHINNQKLTPEQMKIVLG